MNNLITYVFVYDIDFIFLFLSTQSLINELQISIFDTPKKKKNLARNKKV